MTARRPWLRWSLLVGAPLLLLALGAAGLWGHRWLLGSLPRLDGELALPGLVATVVVERDSQGVPTLHAESRLDLARATGFVHAQDRFFQMDLARRRAAGELAEVLGEAGLELDREARPHRFRAAAQEAWERLPEAQRRLLDAYAEGVAAGLESLEEPPFEYLLLRLDPAPWQPLDGLLVIYSMYLRLQDSEGDYDAGRGLLWESLPPASASFLMPTEGSWAAPLPGYEARPRVAPQGPPTSVLGQVSRGAAAPLPAPVEERREGVELGGSNAWAVAGSRTASGLPLLANDMHLSLGLPTTWYRVDLRWRSTFGEHRVTGVTLPGLPLVVAGSNGRVAWGLADAEADSTDVVWIEAEEVQGLRTDRETLRVRGGGEETVEVHWSPWGPVVALDTGGRLRAVRWTAHQPGAADLTLGGLETAQTVREALEVAARSGMPAQSLIVADAAGSIAWTVAGRLPRRLPGFDPSRPVAAREAGPLWDGWLPPADVPRVVDPPGGAVWAANNQLVSGEAAERVGDGGYSLGARAVQIRDALLGSTDLGPADMLALQLDDRALFLERWRELLLELLTPEAVAADPRRSELRRLVEDWTGRAEPESAAYRLVRGFRLTAAEELLLPLATPARAADPDYDYLLHHERWEESLWLLVADGSASLLPEERERRKQRLLAVVDATLDYYSAGGEPLAEQTWGRANALRLAHPLAGLPGVGALLGLRLDPLPLPGDLHVPRVQTRSLGASMRLVVSPGGEADGIFQLPGGQSGHPASDHFADGLEDWAAGTPVPLLPGPAQHRLRLVPAP